MSFNTKIKWTINAEDSEIVFSMKYLLLTSCDDLYTKINDDDKPNAMYLTTKELTATIDYNLIIFEEKGSTQFWKRETFSGLLQFKNSGRNMLITLQYIVNSFDACGRAAATYWVKGKLDEGTFATQCHGLPGDECIILNSELIFEGSIQLIQKE